MGFTLPEYGSSELFYCMRGSERFNLLYYCTECEKAYQKYSSTSYGRKLEYYEDFPSISCKREICPKCVETLNAVEIG